MLKSKSGFTIVELVIVISVIGILLGVSVVGYSGYQVRMRNNSRIVAAQQSINLLKTYLNFNNTLPGSGTGAASFGVCLTTDNVCTNFNGAAPAINNSSFINTLKTSGAPIASVDRTNQTDYYGLYFDTYDVRYFENKLAPVFVMYFLEGSNQSCKNDNTAEFVSSGTNQYWKRSTTGYTDNKVVSGRNTTLCYVSVS